ncbi:MAG: MotA/TolQ/ExbB proton channel family protein [Deltaproteobacteria bacterium]|nr:MotA/TolQ/ExbB proton channel family protein [Deltaproteobacteria bacterium]
MPPLAVLSAVMWALILERFFFLRRMGRRSLTRSGAGRLLKAGARPAEGMGALAHLVSYVLDRRTRDPETDQYLLDEAVLVLSREFDRRLSLIGALAAAAPLLGLLGTVLGMIGAFETLSAYGTGNARALAGSVSEALLSTQAGLLVAIPGLTMKNHLSRRAYDLKRRVSAAGIYLSRVLSESQTRGAVA